VESLVSARFAKHALERTNVGNQCIRRQLNVAIFVLAADPLGTGLLKNCLRYCRPATNESALLAPLITRCRGQTPALMV